MRVFDESKHARGTGAKGGQFVAKGASGAGQSVGYDSARGTGAGYGTKGGDKNVKSLQTYLNHLGFTDSAGNPLKVDGKLGPRTTAAIKKLQRKLGIKADGIVTPSLLHRIRQASIAKGKRVKARAATKRTVPQGQSKGPAKRVSPAPAAPKKRPTNIRKGS